jgi:hypothetical protein
VVTRQSDPLGGSEWARHSHDGWETKARDKRLPTWLRIAALAYAKHGNNGHASFGRGEMGEWFGAPGKPLNRRRLSEYIHRAIELDFLMPGSTSMCLIVPPWEVDRGVVGQPKMPCRVHGRRGAAGRVSGLNQDSLREVSRLNQDPLEQVSCSNPDSSGSRSISYPPLTPVTVTGRASTTEDREASA